MNPRRDCFKQGLVGFVVWAALGSSAAATDAGGGPGVGSAWTTGAKQGLGTSTTVQSKVWFTIAQGIVTEVYYPQVDVPNVQDLQLVITDSSSFVDLERDATKEVPYLCHAATPCMGSVTTPIYP